MKSSKTDEDSGRPPQRKKSEEKKRAEEQKKRELEQKEKEAANKQEEDEDDERTLAERMLLEEQSRRVSLTRTPPPDKDPVEAALTEVGRKRGRDLGVGVEGSSPKRSHSWEDERTGEAARRGEIRGAEDKYEECNIIVAQLKTWASKQLKSKTLSKVSCSSLEAMLGDLQRVVTLMWMESNFYRGKAEGRHEVLDLIKEGFESVAKGSEPSKGSYAGAVAGRREMKETGRRGRTPPTKNVILVRKEGGQPSEARKVLKDQIHPKRDNLDIIKTTAVKNGIALEVASKEGLERIMEKQEIT